ncbi:MAG TPA: SAM-dependent methyltransferase [Acidimicrobiales bacterium]|nr:SAM-dependent methyltransferase [Acidimicrobiales bacterium]
MSDQRSELRGIDETVPHAARVYDYFLGGETNFAVDRAAAEAAAEMAGGLARVRAEVQANRAFLVRAVRHLVREAGVRQFLDLGTGIPAGDNVHAVALQEASDARIVYVDQDPVVLAHAHVLLRGTEGSTTFLLEDVRAHEKILARAADLLDLASEPVAVMMVGLLHHLRDADDPAGLVARYMAGVPAGSYLVVSHLASDIHADGYVEAGEQLDAEMDEPLLFRDRDAVAAYFAGLEMVEPGLVPVDDWRPDAESAQPNGDANPLHVGVGRKPGA